MFRYLKTLFGYISLGSFAISDARRVRFALEALVLAGLLYYEQTIAEFVMAPKLVQVVTVLLASHLFANFVRFFLTTAYRRRHKIKVGEQDNFLLGLEALVLLFTILVTLGSIFPIYDIPFTDFVMSLSVFSVAIVWGFHQYITNFFDGLRLMFSDDFRLGDYIKIGDNSKGIITHVSFRATRLRTDEGNIVFVPNTTILNTEVTNYSKLKYKRIVVPFTVKRMDAESFQRFENNLRQKIADQFGTTVAIEKTVLAIESTSPETIDLSLQIVTDQYSFVIEEEVSKKVQQFILELA